MTEEELKIQKDHKEFCLALYILYVFGILSQVFEATILPGFALLLVTYIFSLIRKRAKTVKGTLFENHIRWMLRTLYIGTGVYVPLAIIIAGIAIFKLTDLGILIEPFMSGSEQALLKAIDVYMKEELGTINTISIVTFAPVVLWFIRRYFIGIKYLCKMKAIEKVKSWL